LTGSIFLYALQLVLTQWWLASFNPQTVTLYLLLIMNVIIAIWWSILGVGWQAPSRTEWLVVIVLALVSTWFARLAIFGAIQRIGSGQVALLWPVQTLLIIVLSVLFLNERMMPIQWAGGALIVSSAALAIRRFRMRTPVVRLQG
ncbi:MAG: DMT family transporter, partial [Caldilineaceae bacterium]|nr:DMT family transporter [Caldilineaceae bacterium]